jgi:hypothetical protein
MPASLIVHDFTPELTGSEPTSLAAHLNAFVFSVGPPNGLTSVNNQIFPYWDAEYLPGEYEVRVLSAESELINYFCVGPIALPNQITPVKPTDRFGIEFIVFGDFRTPIRGTGMIVGSGPLSPFAKVISGVGQRSVTLRLAPGNVTRIECWVQRMSGPLNPAHLPTGIDTWPRIIEGPGGVGTNFIIEDGTSFSDTFPCIIRRTIEADGMITFASEDGGGLDFNDLVIRLRRLGD